MNRTVTVTAEGFPRSLLFKILKSKIKSRQLFKRFRTGAAIKVQPPDKFCGLKGNEYLRGFCDCIFYDLRVLRVTRH